MTIDPAHVATLTMMLSAERLGSLHRLTGSALAAIEIHQDILRCNAQLMAAIATVEISIRNSVSENLARHFGNSDWLQRPPISFRWREPELTKIRVAVDSAKRDTYSKLSQPQKAALDAKAFPSGRSPGTSHIQRSRARMRQLQVTEGKVIAELTMFFWKRLFSHEYEHWLWKPTLKRTFPSKSISRAIVAENLENIYQARNRIAHHESVVELRFRKALNSIKFVAENLESNQPGPATALAKLLYEDLATLEITARALHARLDSFKVGTP